MPFEILERNTVYFPNREISLVLYIRLSQLLDKITQVDNSCKLQLQSLSARIMELETENDNIKTENNKLRNEIRIFKGKLKSFDKLVYQLCVDEGNGTP